MKSKIENSLLKFENSLTEIENRESKIENRTKNLSQSVIRLLLPEGHLTHFENLPKQFFTFPYFQTFFEVFLKRFI